MCGTGGLQRYGGRDGACRTFRVAQLCDLGLEGGGAFGRPCLALERPGTRREFGRKITRAVELLGDPRQLLLGATPSALCDSHAGGLVQHGATLPGLARREGLDLPLADDGQRVASEPPRRQGFLQVEQAARATVDTVVGVTGTGQATPHLDLGGSVLLTIELQRDLGQAGGRTGCATLIQDVAHTRCAELAGPLLTECPHDGLGEVALAGPVRTDDDVEPRPQFQGHIPGKRLETADLDPSQHDVVPVSPAMASVAAACSDACLELPAPFPASFPPTNTRVVKIRACGGPSRPTTS